MTRSGKHFPAPGQHIPERERIAHEEPVRSSLQRGMAEAAAGKLTPWPRNSVDVEPDDE